MVTDVEDAARRCDVALGREGGKKEEERISTVYNRETQKEHRKVDTCDKNEWFLVDSMVDGKI